MEKFETALTIKNDVSGKIIDNLQKYILKKNITVIFEKEGRMVNSLGFFGLPSIEMKKNDEIKIIIYAANAQEIAREISIIINK